MSGGSFSYDQHSDWRLIRKRIKMIQTKLVYNLPNAITEFQRERGQTDDREIRKEKQVGKQREKEEKNEEGKTGQSR